MSAWQRHKQGICNGTCFYCGPVKKTDVVPVSKFNGKKMTRVALLAAITASIVMPTMKVKR